VPRSVASTRARRVAGQQGRVRSQLQGVASVRKLIRQLPSAVKDEMADILVDVSPDFLGAAKADAPVRTGALRDALGAKVLKASLRLRVGLLGKRTNADFFYGRIVEFGRKAQTVVIKRGPRAGAKMQVRAIQPRHFVFAKRANLRERLNNRLGSVWEHALAHAGAGTDTDD
jgi:hypothetical protein